MTVGLNAFILVAGLLFAIGMFGVILRKNTLVIYMSLELMLNGVILALVAFSRYAEVALGLAIIVALFRLRQSVMVDQLTSLSR